jgi:predicted nucleic acid-binding protein
MHHQQDTARRSSAGPCHATPVLAEVTSEVPIMTGNLWHDAEAAVLMREHGIRRICTRDTDFVRFPFLEVIDPLVSEP